MAHECYLLMKGQKQGAFKGESTRKTGNENWMEVLAFSMAGDSSRDLSTGQVTGRRQYRPVVFVKAWGAASPQILTAFATNEVLTQVLFQFARVNADGEEYIFQTVTLTNATVSGFIRFTNDPEANHTKSTPSGSADTQELERVSLIFQKITVEDTDGQTSFSDDWAATV